MRSNLSISRDWPFILNEANLARICTLFQARIGAISISAQCADEITRSFESAKQLFQYANPKDREILRLSISARSEDFEKSARVAFSQSKYSSISFDCEARDDVTTRLRDDVLDIIKETRPWYWRLHKLDFFLLLFGALFLLILGSMAAVFFEFIRLSDNPKPSPPGSDVKAQFLMVLGFSVLLGGAFSISFMRDRCFPRSVFLIGAAINRFEITEKIQWGVIIAFAISCITTALFSIK